MHSPNLTFSHSHIHTLIHTNAHTHNNTRIGARISAFVFFLPVQIGEGVVMDLRGRVEGKFKESLGKPEEIGLWKMNYS